MSRTVVSCASGDDLHDVWQTMSTRGLQNIPVLDAGTRPIGILDIRDAMDSLFRLEEQLESLLSNYVAGIGYR
jgi:predicted transcriptional regulator